jgi:hypothetical protein
VVDEGCPHVHLVRNQASTAKTGVDDFGLAESIQGSAQRVGERAATSLVISLQDSGCRGEGGGWNPCQVDNDASYGDSSACGRDSHEGALVGAVKREACYDLLTLCDLLLVNPLPVGKGGKQFRLKKGFQTVAAGRLARQAIWLHMPRLTGIDITEDGL